MAYVRLLLSTELSIIPYSCGKIEPPKNRTSHSWRANKCRLLVKAIGKLKTAESMAFSTCKSYPFRVLYPPRYDVIKPPRITPAIGAVNVIVI